MFVKLIQRMDLQAVLLFSLTKQTFDNSYYWCMTINLYTLNGAVRLSM